MGKEKKVLLTICLLTCLASSSCSLNNEGEEYVLLYSGLEPTLNYLNSYGPATSNWEGVYSETNSSFEYDPEDDNNMSYTLLEKVYAKEIDELCHGLDESSYTLSDGSNFIWSEFYDGEAWYQNRYGTIYKNSTDTLEINYFTHELDKLNSITNFFLNLLDINSLTGLEEVGYTFNGNIYQSTIDESIEVSLEVTYTSTDFLHDGSLSLFTTYDSEGNLILFTYTMDDITIGKGNITLTTHETISAYEYSGDIGVPPWLAPYY